MVDQLTGTIHQVAVSDLSGKEILSNWLRKHPEIVKRAKSQGIEPEMLPPKHEKSKIPPRHVDQRTNNELNPHCQHPSHEYDYYYQHQYNSFDSRSDRSPDLHLWSPSPGGWGPPSLLPPVQTPERPGGHTFTQPYSSTPSIHPSHFGTPQPLFSPSQMSSTFNV